MGNVFFELVHEARGLELVRHCAFDVADAVAGEEGCVDLVAGCWWDAALGLGGRHCDGLGGGHLGGRLLFFVGEDGWGCGWLLSGLIGRSAEWNLGWEKQLEADFFACWRKDDC